MASAPPCVPPALLQAARTALRREQLPQIVQHCLELALHSALVQEPAAHPGAEAWGSPHVTDRDGRRARACIETEERLPALTLPSLHPAERGGRAEIDHLELGLAPAEPCLEPNAFAERHVALDAVASREPLGDRSEEHTSELQSQSNIVCRLLL